MNNFGALIAYRVLALLEQHNARLRTDVKNFYVWKRPGRTVVIFDTNTINPRKVDANFAHDLQTRLQGRTVVRTNTHGLFLQISETIPPMLTDLNMVNLDLKNQPSPFHLPMGMTERGPLWITLMEGDSFLIGGTRNYGKSGFLHGWIQALLHGKSTLVYAYDGKAGSEFGRYMGRENFHLAINLGETLRQLLNEAMKRRDILLASGCPNVKVYNEQHIASPLMPIALVIDEAKLCRDDEKATLAQIVERERDTGVHPIIGTNNPMAEELLMKSNLATRICFPVPSWQASQMVLGVKGAEILPKIQGRGMILFGAKVTEFQSFFVDYPKPSDEAVDAIRQLKMFDPEQTKKSLSTEMAKRARELKTQGESLTAIIADLFGSAGGAQFYERKQMVLEVLGADI